MPHRLLRQWESPPTWLLLCLVAAWLQSRWLPLLPMPDPVRWMGVGLALAGALLLVMAAAQFRRHRTTILPRETPSSMIKTGAFGVSRNPIYLADAMMLAGAALWLDGASLVLVPVFMAIITRRFILGEEAAMRTVFGAEFDRWSAQVNRWVGVRRG